MDKRISFQEINDVHISVRRSKEKWEIIGSGLGLSESLLKQIKIDQNNMPDKCLYSALDVWLHGKTNQAVTWRVLLNILKSPEINESVLADKIANKKGFSSFDGSLPKDSYIKQSSEKSTSTTTPSKEVAVALNLDHLPFLLKNLKDVASKWKQIGTYLYISNGDLQNIEANLSLIPNSPVSFLQEVLTHWLRYATSSMPNADKLLGALETCGEYQLSCALKESLINGDHQKELLDLSCLTLPSFILEDYVRSHYQNSLENQHQEWPPVLEVEYINLVLIKQEKIVPKSSQKVLIEKQGDVESILKHSHFQMKSLNLKDITNLDSYGKSILVEGCPGIGKTTLSCKLRQEWATGKMLRDFWLLLYIPLRSPLMRTAQSFDDLLQYFGTNYSYHDSQRIKKTFGKGVMIILDGWDELRPSCREKDMFFPKLIEGQILPECTIIITSRPGATDDIRGCTSKHVEILGFTEVQIHQYIMKYFKENEAAGRKLIEDLKAFPNVASACYIAVNLTIVCYVYLVSDYTLPETLTEVYELFVVNTIKRHYKKSTVPEVNVETISDCDKFVKGMINSLSKLALQSLEKNDLGFTKDELKETCSVDESESSFDGFGLLRIITVFRKYRTESSYYFLHLTIHEFLAAYSIFLMPESDKWTWLGNNMSNERFAMVLKFFCGMDRFRSNSSRILFSDKRNIYAVPFTLECIFEGQWKDGCKEIAQKMEYQMFIWRPIQPYRALVYSYIISNSKGPWELQWNCKIDEHSVKCLSQYLVNAPHSLKIFKISKINLSATIANSLSDILKSQKQLKFFSINNSSFEKTSFEMICLGLCSHEALQTLQLINTGITNLSLETLCALILTLPSLEQLDLRGNDLVHHKDASIKIAEAVSMSAVSTNVILF